MIKLKKKAAVARAYNWRPNFRNYETLPDIRAVRTQFFLPTISIAIAAVFALFILSREYKAMNIRANIATLKQEIESYETKHDEKVEQNAEFMKIVRTLDDVVEFRKDQLVGSDFLLEVSSRLTEGMYLTRVEFIGDSASIEGQVQVPAEEASHIVDSYLKSLQEGDVLQGLLTEYKLTSLDRDENSNTIKFRIQVTAKEEKK